VTRIPQTKYAPPSPTDSSHLAIDAGLVEQWLVAFLRTEILVQRKISKVVLGLSGGVDSAVIAYLAAKAFGPENVLSIRMPYKVSSPESLSHAQLVIDDLGIQEMTIPITEMVDGYLEALPEPATPHRIGNICSRSRMIALFDQSMRIGGLPLGTGNKTERLLGYYTWHGDDAPPVNALGDLYKTQVWALAKHIGVPDVIVNKPASADLIEGQTDEKDFGITYPEADRILDALIRGLSIAQLVDEGFDETKLKLVEKRLEGTHWKRRIPTVAMMSDTAIGEYYLRPVDYR
jgi:NAD+ synthetase